MDVDQSDTDSTAAQDRAVADSRRLLQEHWTRWCADRGVDPVVPETRPPVVYQVGMNAADAEWVALIRFDVVIAGHRWHGMARGPVDEPIFQVQRTREGESGHGRRGGLRRAARRWRRRNSR